ncbi:hypothetical protein [Gorillibacterium massiliense]|uniref:hypothetical protein n=1 Tax=Gorillibacterium massiliense TaxID=1280390 RepID=UPI000594D101|nr:hypothetical protein [Gorillibacterium massiliense]
MKASELIKDLLPMIANRVINEVNNRLEEHGVRGIPRSSTAFFDSISVGYLALNSELGELFKKLNTVSINEKELSELEVIISQFINEQYKVINNICKGVVGDDLISQYKPDEYSRTRLKETKALLEFEYKVIGKRIKDKKKTVRWEIFKLTFSSIFGATITLIVKTYLER